MNAEKITTRLVIASGLMMCFVFGLCLAALNPFPQPEVLTAEDVPRIVRDEPAAKPEPFAATTRTYMGEYKITHYCACEKCCGKWADGYTATGTVATEGRTIAVDPDIIPYGSQVVIRYADGTEQRYIAEDCGGAIQGNRIDVYLDSHADALAAGVKAAEVYIESEEIICPS